MVAYDFDLSTAVTVFIAFGTGDFVSRLISAIMTRYMVSTNYVWVYMTCSLMNATVSFTIPYIHTLPSFFIYSSGEHGIVYELFRDFKIYYRI